jgi:hypothetical protein
VCVVRVGEVVMNRSDHVVCGVAAALVCAAGFLWPEVVDAIVKVFMWAMGAGLVSP